MSISGSSTQGGDDEDYSAYGYDYALYRAYQRMSSSGKNGENQSEAMGVLPKKVKFQVTVTAGFDLKSK